MKKRLLAALLYVIMVLTLLPMTAFATSPITFPAHPRELAVAAGIGNSDTAGARYTISDTSPTITGDSVYRTSETDATVRFSSNAQGTCFYSVDGNPTTTIDALLSGENAGAVTANAITALAIDTELLSPGAKYVHIMVVDGSNNQSNVLNISMPYDIYYFDDFEAYAQNTVVPSNAANITNSTLQMYLKYNGGDANNQKVILSNDNVLQTIGTYGTGLDIRTMLPSSVDSGYIVFEADMLQTAFSESVGTANAGLILGEKDLEERPISVVVVRGSHKFVAQYFEGAKQTSDIVCSLNSSYHVRIEINLTDKNYDYYVNGVKANNSKISFSPDEISWFGVFNGASCANFDNIKFYVTDSISRTITYEANGGSGTMSNGIATSGTAFTLPACSFTAPDGKRFKEWAIGSATGTKVAAGGSYIFTEATSVFALWETDTYSVTYDTSGGTAITAGSYCIEDTSFTLPAAPTRTGYRFDGWKVTSGATGGSGFVLNDTFSSTTRDLIRSFGDVTLTAQWTANTDTAYRVEHYVMDTDGNWSTTATKIQDLTGTSDASLVPSKLKDAALEVTNGIVYSHGEVDGSVVSETIVLPDGSQVIKLYYSREQHSLALSKGAGIDSVVGIGQHYFGQQVTINALVSHGYTWEKWTSSNTTLLADSTTKDYSFNMPAGSAMLTASATPTQYSVSYASNGGTGIMASGTATYGTPFELPKCGFTAPAGKHFKEWAIGSATGTKVAAGGTYSFSADATIYAVWADPIQHEIIEGQNGNWAKNNTDGLGFKTNADYAMFTGVSVDGTALSSDKYSSQSGSTIVTLKAAYLNTLSVGQHTLRIDFTDGYAETHFTIKAAADSSIPATGDSTQLLLWLGIALLACAALATGLVLARKKRQNG